MSIIYVNVRYSDAGTYRKILKKSKSFFNRPGFLYRNGVFTHVQEDFVVHLEKNRIHIAVKNNFEFLRLVNLYLTSIFTKTFLDVDMPGEKADIILSSLNYVLE